MNRPYIAQPGTVAAILYPSIPACPHPASEAMPEIGNQMRFAELAI